MFYLAICECTGTLRPGLRVRQQGMSLLELLVGIAIGLMVVAAAFGTLVINKNTSGTVSDASVLNNQANNALRTISFYVRQAGVLEFIRTGSGYLLDDPPSSANDPQSIKSFSAATSVIRVTNGQANSPDTLTVWGASRQSVSKDCQGKTRPDNAAGGLIYNQFKLKVTGLVFDLVCETSLSNSAVEAIASNVEDFQVRSLVESINGGESQWKSEITEQESARVTAVEICLQIRGELKQPDSMFSGLYRNCMNQNPSQDGYLRAVVRQVIQLRNRSTPPL